jgi:hypothetical protein
MEEVEHHGNESAKTGFDGRAKLKHDGKSKRANWIEEERAKLQAYDYLCHIGEAKQ